MADIRKHSSTSNIVRFVLKNSDTGQGLTGVTSGTVGLIISTICDNESSPVAYSGSNIENISTLGTYAAPTSSKCRFREVSSGLHPGLYEFQFEDARFSVASAKRLVASVNGASSLLGSDYEVQLTQFDPYLAPVIRKNVALSNFTFLLVANTDHITGVTGATVTATRSIDGAAFASCSNSVSEVANGVYKIDLSASDLNGTLITLKFTASGADPRIITLITVG